MAALLAPIAGFLSDPPDWVRVIGFVLAALVVADLLLGYRFHAHHTGRLRQAHTVVGWTLGAVVLSHALLSSGHVLVGHAVSAGAGGHVHVAASPANLTIWLAVEGIALLVFLGFQIAAGYRRFHLSRPQFLSLHSTLAWMIVTFAGIHAVLGVVHLVVG